MRHKASRNRLTQKPDHARMLQRNLVTSLLLYEEIRTTRKRAAVIRPMVDRLITTVKTKEAREAIRSINTVVTDRNASRKLIEVFKERYEKRSSGFTRTKAVGSRVGDGAELVDMSLVDAVVLSSPSSVSEKKTQKIQKTQTTQKKTTATSSSGSSGSSESSQS